VFDRPIVGVAYNNVSKLNALVQDAILLEHVHRTRAPSSEKTTQSATLRN